MFNRTKRSNGVAQQIYEIIAVKYLRFPVCGFLLQFVMQFLKKDTYGRQITATLVSRTALHPQLILQGFA